jgi:ankyrin repeat protein
MSMKVNPSLSLQETPASQAPAHAARATYEQHAGTSSTLTPANPQPSCFSSLYDAIINFFKSIWNCLFGWCGSGSSAGTSNGTSTGQTQGTSRAVATATAAATTPTTTTTATAVATPTTATPTVPTKASTTTTVTTTTTAATGTNSTPTSDRLATLEDALSRLRTLQDVVSRIRALPGVKILNSGDQIWVRFEFGDMDHIRALQDVVSQIRALPGVKILDLTDQIWVSFEFGDMDNKCLTQDQHALEVFVREIEEKHRERQAKELTLEDFTNRYLPIFTFLQDSEKGAWEPAIRAFLDELSDNPRAFFSKRRFDCALFYGVGDSENYITKALYDTKAENCYLQMLLLMEDQEAGILINDRMVKVEHWMIEYLLSKKQGDLSLDEQGNPTCLLHFARSLKTARLLLGRSPALLQQVTLKNDPVLKYAARYGSLEMVKFLMSNGVSFNLLSLPSLYAYTNPNYEVREYLQSLEKEHHDRLVIESKCMVEKFTKASLSKQQASLFLTDAEKGAWKPTIEVFLDEMVDDPVTFFFKRFDAGVLFQGVKYSDIQVSGSYKIKSCYLDLLLIMENQPGMGIWLNGRLVQVEFWMIERVVWKKQGDLTRNTQGDLSYLLHFARSAATAQLLLNQSPALLDQVIGGENENTPLHSAAIRGSVEVAKFLYNHGLDIAVQNEEGTYPFHLCSTKEMVEFFLSVSEAQLTWKDHNGNTTLHYAHNGETAAVLLAKGVSLEALNNKGLTPLAHALESKRFDVARVLIDAGASLEIPNDPDENGVIHLTHLAYCLIRNNKPEAFALLSDLFSSGKIDIECEEEGGLTLLAHLCQVCRHRHGFFNSGIRFVTFLLENGANPDVEFQINGQSTTARAYLLAQKEEEQLLAEANLDQWLLPTT